MAGLPPATRKNKEHPEMGQGRSGRRQHGLASVPETVKGAIEMVIENIEINPNPNPRLIFEAIAQILGRRYGYDVKVVSVEEMPEQEVAS